MYLTQAARCNLGNCKSSIECAQALAAAITAAQASGQRSVVSKANVSTVKSCCTCGNARNSSTRGPGVEVAICVLLEWLQNSSAQEVRIYCTAVQIARCPGSLAPIQIPSLQLSNELVADQPHEFEVDLTCWQQNAASAPTSLQTTQTIGELWRMSASFYM